MSKRDEMMHYLNPLHVYCRLCRIFSKERALQLAIAYEFYFYRPWLGW
ncbi:MAG: hypothetical protein HY097_09950 [Nitrospinae bacterium]|nr:hypothetical protein [Nitrospinota bacterium]MBI3813675.1 hypothetical protein [Nitrospinota bacterium]